MPLPFGTRDAAGRQLWDRAFALALLALAAHGATLAVAGRGFDFSIFVRAADRFLHGEALYPAGDGPWVFKYSPAAAWLFAPFTLLPLRLATALWNVGSVALLWLSARAVARSPGAALPAAAPLVATLALAPPLLLELRFGQVDLVLLALLVFAMELAPRRPWLAGLLAALAILIKLPALLVLVPFALKRNFRALAAVPIAALLLCLPLLIRYGPSGAASAFADWSQMLARTTPLWAPGHNPQGLPTGLLALLTPAGAVPSPAAMAAAQVGALIIFAMLLWLVRRHEPELAALLCAGAALLSPLCWRANLVLELPLFMLASRTRAGRAALAAFFAVGLFVNEAVLAAAPLQAAMMLRPFLLTSLAVIAAVVGQARREIE
jgi:hypothetical protein